MEVDNPKSSNLLSKVEGDEQKMYTSRMEANGAIDQINLNLSEKNGCKSTNYAQGRRRSWLLPLVLRRFLGEEK